MFRLIVATVLLTILGGPMSSALAQAPTASELGLTPVNHQGSFFSLTLPPGGEENLTVELSNHSPEAALASTYAADVYTIINGGFGAALDDSAPTGPTLWLDYAAETLEVEGKTSTQRDFTVTVPPGTAPGQYITSLVVQNVEPIVNTTGDLVLNQIHRRAIAVAINVSDASPPRAPLEGETLDTQANFFRKPALSVEGATHAFLSKNSIVGIQLQNNGNVHIKPEGEFVLLDSSGLEVTRHPVAMAIFYAGSSTSVEIPFSSALLPGDYLIQLNLSTEAGDQYDEVHLNVPAPTQAEADGAPTGATVADINQTAPGGSSLPLVAGVAAAVVALLLLSGALVHRRRQTAA